ncbi:MAG: proton-conducting transporter transmembrane domain-containing protein [Lutibacter sp.]
MSVYFIIGIILACIVLLTKNKSVTHYLVYLFNVVQVIFVINSYFNINSTELSYFKFDSIGILFAFILAILSFIAAIHYHIYEKNQNQSFRTVKIHNSIFIFFNIALMGVYFSSQYGLLWAFIEATTLTGATLIYHDRKKIVLEAVWKYVFACSVSITLAFVGILLLSVAAQEVNLTELSFSLLREKAIAMNPVWLKGAFLFILVGFSVKMGIVPMFNVDIDAKDVAPFPISALFSTVLLNAGFLALYRFFDIFKATSIGYWMNTVLLISGILTLIFAAAYLLKVKNYKRMYAYSSMEHAGLVVIALSLGKAGILAAFLHLTFHAIIKSGLFFQIGQIMRLNNRKKINITGYFYQNPLGAFVLLFGSLAILGLPPSGLFISELLIFKSLIIQKNWIVIVLILGALSVIFFILMQEVLKLLFYPSSETTSTNLKGTYIENGLQLGLIALSIYFGVFQNELLFSLIQSAL